MNERLKAIAVKAQVEHCISHVRLEQFAELIVADVLDQVAERAHYCGDRAWSDELDRRWIELEYGFGELAAAAAEKTGR